uniref:Fungal lipase-like domain-containing protein n=1 Tax=Panagrolaimus davidi TaxID=227884 RepID=A0A914PSF5_9BILA
MKDDFLTLKNANHGYDLWITGHSLGAAMASLAATTIATNKLFPANKIKLVTFGQPRVGDVSYANLVDSIIPHSYRIIHQNDVVPSSPPEWLFGYHHHKSEIWFNNDMTSGQKYIECDEDESQKCSDGAFNMDMIEHLWYYNVLANFATDGCQGWNIHK